MQRAATLSKALSPRLVSFAAMLAGAAAFSIRAAEISLPITADTYIDSRTTNATNNYGVHSVLRTLVNSSDASVCRSLLQLPPELLLYAADQIANAAIALYVWQDNTGARNITLFPLDRPFVEGTGAVPADGATWFTCDGTNAWTNPGGDFDTNFPVVGVKGPVLDTNMNDRYFFWDITDLLAHSVARSKVLSNGVLLQIDELPIPPSGTPRAPFTSSDDTIYAAEFKPQLLLDVIPRTTDVQAVFLESGALVMSVADCTPFVTNYIERSVDLLQPDGWMAVTALVAAGQTANWVVPFDADWTNAYYRIRTE